MGSEARNQYGAAVAVVAGIVDVLETGGEIDAAPEVDGIVGFEDVFATVVQCAIA